MPEVTSQILSKVEVRRVFDEGGERIDYEVSDGLTVYEAVMMLEVAKHRILSQLGPDDD